MLSQRSLPAMSGGFVGLWSCDMSQFYSDDKRDLTEYNGKSNIIVACLPLVRQCAKLSKDKRATVKRESSANSAEG